MEYNVYSKILQDVVFKDPLFGRIESNRSHFLSKKKLFLQFTACLLSDSSFNEDEFVMALMKNVSDINKLLTLAFIWIYHVGNEFETNTAVAICQTKKCREICASARYMETLRDSGIPLSRSGKIASCMGREYVAFLYQSLDIEKRQILTGLIIRYYKKLPYNGRRESLIRLERSV